MRVCSPRASDLGRPVAPGGIQSVAFSSSSARCMTPPPIFRFGSRAAVVAGLMVRPVCPQLRKCAARPQKTLLELFALLISELQGTEPALGLVCRSKGKPTTIRLTPGLQIARSLLREIKGLRQGLSTPMLVLNSHCLVCEFHRRCRAQALKEDNLSLLRGMNDLQITRLNKKGIFTVNQLSYTFKTRRRPKRAQKSSAVHHFPLRALALREKKIFLHGTPDMALGAHGSTWISREHRRVTYTTSLASSRSPASMNHMTHTGLILEASQTKSGLAAALRHALRAAAPARAPPGPPRPAARYAGR